MTRQPFVRIALVLVLAAAAATAAVAPALADQDPNMARGFSPEKLYDYSGLDAVNLFNGNLTLTIPVGGRYPVGDGFDYGLLLTYNTNVWKIGTAARTEPIPGVSVTAYPQPSFNAGLGWTISLGGRLYGSDHVDSAAHRWRFESETGAEHVFFEDLHEGESSSVGGADCLFTRDGTYLRLCQEDADTWTVEFPGGTVRTFDRSTSGYFWENNMYRLVKIEDRLGNWVEVEYSNQGRSWTIEDSVQRSHTVQFQDYAVGARRQRVVTSATLAGFGGAAATWTFGHAYEVVRRSCKDEHPETPDFLGVPLLRSIALPAAAGSYRMDDADSYFEQPDCSLLDRPGLLHRLRLPTGGRLEWEYQEYAFFNRRDPPIPETLSVEVATGVLTKRALGAGGSCPSGTLADCTWTYTWDRETIPGQEASGNRWTTVRSPLGDETVSYFRNKWISNDPARLWQGWDYGLPFSDSQTATAQDGTTVYLSQQVFEGSAAGGTLLRSVWVDYQRDQLKSFQSRGTALEWYSSNRRVRAERTHFDDDLWESPPSSGNEVPRFTESRMSDFDGLGHYRLTVSQGNLRIPESPSGRSDFQRYNPSRGSYLIDPVTNGPVPGQHTYGPLPDSQPWVLGTYDKTTASEGGTIEARFCFDGNTGRLERERRMVSTGLNSRDVVVDRGRTRIDPTEIHDEIGFYGSDGQTVSTASNWCDVAPTAQAPVYRTRQTSRYGVPSKVERLTSSGSVLLVEADRSIDAATGLVAASTDPSLLATDFDYDELGRLTAIEPHAGGDGWTRIVYDAAAGASPAQAYFARRANGSVSGPVLQEGRYTFDPIGRVVKDEMRVPGHAGWQAVATKYNALGWKTSASERGSTSKTEFRNFDPFGRPRQIRLPDYPSNSAHRVELYYIGARRIGREVSIATSLTGAETRATTSELYDFMGRLWRLKEPSGTAGAEINTDYSYDAAHRLKTARIRGPIDQWRYFNYDGRGFLASEAHPERGTTSFSKYDPLGNAGRVRTGPVEGPFDLRYVYDAAGRLTTVSEWRGPSGTGGRLLKELAYGNGTSIADRSKGKIKTAVRHNHVLHPSNGNELDVTVTETYFYGGAGGRASRRDTALNTDQSFTQSWVYDDLGQVTLTGYPTCTHGALCNTTGNRHPRTVSRTYDQGFLTRIVGFADPIEYHRNGMLAEVHHANGMVYGQGMDAHGMRRPASLWLESAGQLTAFAPGFSSLAGQAVPLPYEYDGAGNVEAWGDESYRYDLVSRIVETALPNGSDNQSYTYDPYGNLTSITTDGSTRTLAVDISTNRLSASPYDAAGNLTQWGGIGSSNTFSWDAFSMMWHRGGTGAHDSYIYSADDERIWTVDASVSPWRETFFLRDLDGKVLRTFETENGAPDLAWQEDYVHRHGQPLATVKADAAAPGGEAVFHFHVNHLGTPLVTTDAQQTFTATHFLYPFGEEKYPSTDPERLRFTGHERDHNGAGTTDDLDYMHARYFGPLTGRFLSVDPAVQPERALTRPQLWNRYSYALNNPLAFVDPTGMQANDSDGGSDPDSECSVIDRVCNAIRQYEKEKYELMAELQEPTVELENGEILGGEELEERGGVEDRFVPLDSLDPNRVVYLEFQVVAGERVKDSAKISVFDLTTLETLQTKADMDNLAGTANELLHAMRGSPRGMGTWTMPLTSDQLMRRIARDMQRLAFPQSRVQRQRGPRRVVK